jgi:hypothetical protein
MKCLEKECPNDNLINKSVDLDKILNILNSSSTSSSASTNSKTSNVLSLFNLAKGNKDAFSIADFINSVKFSTSEPNLSNHTINQSSTTNSNKNTTNRCSLLRKSISFNKDEDLEDSDSKKETSNSDSKKENLNDTDESKIDTKQLKDHVSNAKIFNQVKDFFYK